ncbi:unnamed protein product [Aphanomyces euteiches]|uniref:Annexin n=1 Tax=Aphanomyces euteiches TaxID=100861 RepID=A0A6G0WR19_9STRA|nr:hypothetical protein Ae201684_012542 [Aphanomyces euteiches]KAH9090314.1 hypothetical protein Ae201684P_014120 [Aphanomyces euteiches]KAH9103864.1 hypothetical protein AeMF1_019905 [Aphanomyces euteiches]KAH9151431.1 hypothetical protein AeRB84_005950 [Aphanomyces euteiches]KAH9161261.1 hypothetical protein LEN26_001503 [Aphanomyces euteiches]
MSFLRLYPQQAYEINNGVAVNHASPEIDNICHEIKAACAGFGTDEDRLNRVLGSLKPSTRHLVSLRYPELHKGRTLLQEVTGETSGHYGKLCQLLAQPLEEAEAMIIRNATKGMGTNEDLLYPVLGGRSPEELAILKKAFFKVFGEDLVVIVSDDVGGDLKKHYLAVLNALAQRFDPAIHTQHKAEELAEIIYKAGEGKWGTDETTFCNTLWSIPPEFLRAVDAAYVAKHKNNLHRAIEKEFGGHTERAMLYNLNMILDPINTIADQFERTMKGMGTDEYGLSAALIRYQEYLPHVAPVYKAKYGQSLRDRIYGETSGDFRKLLMIVVENSL